MEEATSTRVSSPNVNNALIAKVHQWFHHHEAMTQIEDELKILIKEGSPYIHQFYEIKVSMKSILQTALSTEDQQIMETFQQYWNQRGVPDKIKIWRTVSYTILIIIFT